MGWLKFSDWLKKSTDRIIKGRVISAWWSVTARRDISLFKVSQLIFLLFLGTRLCSIPIDVLHEPRRTTPPPSLSWWIGKIGEGCVEGGYYQSAFKSIDCIEAAEPAKEESRWAAAFRWRRICALQRTLTTTPERTHCRSPEHTDCASVYLRKTLTSHATDTQNGQKKLVKTYCDPWKPITESLPETFYVTFINKWVDWKNSVPS